MNPVVTANINPVVNPVIAPVIDNEINVDVDMDVNITGIDMTEGKWFATIKGDKVRIEFRAGDDDNHWSNNSDFALSEFPTLPKGEKGTFSLTREAGTIAFSGKFEDDMGFGTYKFTANKQFDDYIRDSGVTDVKDRDAFVFFMVNLKKGYVENARGGTSTRTLPRTM